jgi:hypothetical protein
MGYAWFCLQSLIRAKLHARAFGRVSAIGSATATIPCQKKTGTIAGFFYGDFQMLKLSRRTPMRTRPQVRYV